MAYSFKPRASFLISKFQNFTNSGNFPCNYSNNKARPFGKQFWSGNRQKPEFQFHILEIQFQQHPDIAFVLVLVLKPIFPIWNKNNIYALFLVWPCFCHNVPIFVFYSKCELSHCVTYEVLLLPIPPFGRKNVKSPRPETILFFGYKLIWYEKPWSDPMLPI